MGRRIEAAWYRREARRGTVTYVGWDWLQSLAGGIYGSAALLFSVLAPVPSRVAAVCAATALLLTLLLGAFFRLTIAVDGVVLRKGWCGVTTGRWAVHPDGAASVEGTLDWGMCGDDGGDVSAELELDEGVTHEGLDRVMFGPRNLADPLVAAVNRDLDARQFG